MSEIDQLTGRRFKVPKGYRCIIMTPKTLEKIERRAFDYAWMRAVRECPSKTQAWEEYLKSR